MLQLNVSFIFWCQFYLLHFENNILPLLAVWMRTVLLLSVSVLQTLADSWINKSIQSLSSLLIRTLAYQQAPATLHPNQWIIDFSLMDQQY